MSHPKKSRASYKQYYEKDEETTQVPHSTVHRHRYRYPLSTTVSRLGGWEQARSCSRATDKRSAAAPAPTTAYLRSRSRQDLISLGPAENRLSGSWPILRESEMKVWLLKTTRWLTLQPKWYFHMIPSTLIMYFERFQSPISWLKM